MPDREKFIFHRFKRIEFKNIIIIAFFCITHILFKFPADIFPLMQLKQCESESVRNKVISLLKHCKSYVCKLM